MNSEWAAETLQTIRTLMERSTVYRRALAPIMLFTGSIGLTAGLAGAALPITGMPAFGVFWFAVACLALAGAFLIARRQAFRDREPFWSPPTRRVSQALLPPLTAGFASALAIALKRDGDLVAFYVLLCVFFYGCAIHAAGFFMPRGMKLLGWAHIGGATLLTAGLVGLQLHFTARTGHLVMAFFFGLLHLAYGTYLRMTAKPGPRA
jgi:hypothetical protein